MRSEKITASIIIPTFNGGDDLKFTLRAISNQKVDFLYEIIIIDSESNDGVLQTIDEKRTKIISIKKAEFQHGKTRNDAASYAVGEFLIFITQDATPSCKSWLYDFVHAMKIFSEAAFGFGRHFARPTASPFIKKEISDHFEKINRYPLLINSKSNIASNFNSNIEYEQFLHFFSDNNSIIKRSVFSKFPFPEVEFGEDQLWANSAIKRGLTKLYCPNSSVLHSHNYDFTEGLKRSWTEAVFFKNEFGYDLGKGIDYNSIEKMSIDQANDRAKLILATDEEIRSEIARKKAQLTGFWFAHNGINPKLITGMPL